MKKKIGAMLILVLMLSTILIENDTVLLNVTESKDNKVDKTTMFISKSYLLGLSANKVMTNNIIKNTRSSTENVLLNKNPKQASKKDEVKKSNADLEKAKQNNVKSETKNINGIKKQTNQQTKNQQKNVTNNSKKVTQKRTYKKSTRSYTQEDLSILTRVIHGESSGQSWNFQVAVGSVVLNRVKSKKYPNTIKGVVFQRGQYACTWDGNYNKTPSEQSKRVAKYLLENGSQLPNYVLFQAEFKQGRGVYKKMGNTYFCY